MAFMSESAELPDDSSQPEIKQSPHAAMRDMGDASGENNHIIENNPANNDLQLSRYGQKSVAKKSYRFPLLHSPVLLGILGVIFLSVIVFAVNSIIQERQRAPITASVLAYQPIRHDTALKVLVRIQRIDPQKSASCVIQALDTANNEVGRREFLILPSKDKSRDLYMTISTLSQANHASVYACSLTIPSYLHSEPPQISNTP